MVIFSKPNWNWFGKRVVKIVIFFQTKLELVWKTSRQNFEFFSKPNWNWFGNGHRIKCSPTAGSSSLWVASANATTPGLLFFGGRGGGRDFGIGDVPPNDSISSVHALRPNLLFQSIFLRSGRAFHNMQTLKYSAGSD